VVVLARGHGDAPSAGCGFSSARSARKAWWARSLTCGVTSSPSSAAVCVGSGGGSPAVRLRRAELAWRAGLQPLVGGVQVPTASRWSEWTRGPPTSCCRFRPDAPSTPSAPSPGTATHLTGRVRTTWALSQGPLLQAPRLAYAAALLRGVRRNSTPAQVRCLLCPQLQSTSVLAFAPRASTTPP
jgi:hypothetical protein